jgi:hypothetical protein
MGGPACQGEILPRVLDVSTYLLAFARLTSGSSLTMDDSPDAKSIMKKKRGTEPSHLSQDSPLPSPGGRW